MLLAYNLIALVAVYALSLTVAARPKQIRENVNRLLSIVRSLLFGSTLETSKNEVSLRQTLFPSSATSNVTAPSSSSNLLTKAQVEAEYDQDSWQGRVYADFTEKILAKGSGLQTFPCVYATMGYRSDDHRYVFLDSDNLAEPRNIRKLAPALLEYLRISPTLGPNTSLVIVGAPSEGERSVDDYNRTFWDMLRGLRICDPKAWPDSIPQDTENPHWTFCFNGEPVFPVMLTPAHQQRWSRNMSAPIVALQPKWVLDRLLGTPEKRAAAQNKVRTLLKRYDAISISPDLTNYGEAGTSEIRQLCLQDKNEPVDCPYRNFDE